MKKTPAFLAAVLGGLIVLCGIYLLHPFQSSPAAKTQTAFERVMQAKTLRCGYVVAEPTLVKDPVTGEFHGPVHDIVTSIGEMLGLTIEWTEETTFASAPEGLRTNRYDMICSALYMRPNLMTHVEFPQPYYYLPVYVIQRKGEDRFKNKADIDSPGVTIASIDGTIPALIAEEEFKKAKIHSLPATASYSENLLSVATRKADVVFVDPLFFHAYDKSNPGQLEINHSIPPLRVFANILAVGKGEHDLESMISAAIRHLLNNGRMEEIIRKYEPVPHAILRVSPSYVEK